MKTIKDYFCENCPFKDTLMAGVGFDRLEDIRKISDSLENKTEYYECSPSKKYCKLAQINVALIQERRG